MEKQNIVERPEGLIDVELRNAEFYELCLNIHHQHYPNGFNNRLLRYETPSATWALFKRIWYQRPKALKIGDRVIWVERNRPKGPITIHEMTEIEFEERFF